MKATFLRVERITTHAAMYFACAMLALAAALGLFQIITRFVLEEPAEWTEVMIRFSLIWMVFMGIPMAFRQGAMVSVDVLHRWAGPRMKRVLDTVVMIAIGVSVTPIFVRLTRAQVINVAVEDYIEAARCWQFTVAHCVASCAAKHHRPRHRAGDARDSSVGHRRGQPVISRAVVIQLIHGLFDPTPRRRG